MHRWVCTLRSAHSHTDAEMNTMPLLIYLSIKCSGFGAQCKIFMSLEINFSSGQGVVLGYLYKYTKKCQK